MTPMAWLILAGVALCFGAVGGLITTTWMEWRHDCLPHDPKRCEHAEAGESS